VVANDSRWLRSEAKAGDFRLITRRSKVQILPAQLRRTDDNVGSHGAPPDDGGASCFVGAARAQGRYRGSGGGVQMRGRYRPVAGEGAGDDGAVSISWRVGSGARFLAATRSRSTTSSNPPVVRADRGRESDDGSSRGTRERKPERWSSRWREPPIGARWRCGLERGTARTGAAGWACPPIHPVGGDLRDRDLGQIRPFRRAFFPPARRAIGVN
jgi:hypothetical protein